MVKDVIETRQKALEDVGDAFKAISDQLKADSADVATIQTAAASIPTPKSQVFQKTGYVILGAFGFTQISTRDRFVFPYTVRKERAYL